jgi:hypothetical protein
MALLTNSTTRFAPSFSIICARNLAALSKMSVERGVGIAALPDVASDAFGAAGPP